MTATRTAAAVLLVGAACLGVPATAPAKEDVRARLDAPHALARAEPGSRLRVAWTLSAAPRLPLKGRRSAAAPKGGFGASGVYIAVRGDGASTRIFRAASPGPGYPRGRYVANVEVPRGGASGVRIGLDGWRYVPGQPRVEADVFFPIDNDPFAPAAPRDPPEASPVPWVAGGALLLAVSAAGLKLAARRYALTPPG